MKGKFLSIIARETDRGGMGSPFTSIKQEQIEDREEIPSLLYLVHPNRGGGGLPLPIFD